VHNTHRNKDVPDSFRSEMIVRDSLVHEVDVARFVFDEEIDVVSPAPSDCPSGRDNRARPPAG
jgi:myo-inositol 2-dehydrogenase/D-chiro-inositol 1-dehydrogenase